MLRGPARAARRGAARSERVRPTTWPLPPTTRWPPGASRTRPGVRPGGEVHAVERAGPLEGQRVGALRLDLARSGARGRGSGRRWRGRRGRRGAPAVVEVRPPGAPLFETATHPRALRDRAAVPAQLGRRVPPSTSIGSSWAWSSSTVAPTCGNGTSSRSLPARRRARGSRRRGAPRWTRARSDSLAAYVTDVAALDGDAVVVAEAQQPLHALAVGLDVGRARPSVDWCRRMRERWVPWSSDTLPVVLPVVTAPTCRASTTATSWPGAGQQQRGGQPGEPGTDHEDVRRRGRAAGRRRAVRRGRARARSRVGRRALRRGPALGGPALVGIDVVGRVVLGVLRAPCSPRGLPARSVSGFGRCWRDRCRGGSGDRPGCQGWCRGWRRGRGHRSSSGWGMASSGTHWTRRMHARRGVRRRRGRTAGGAVPYAVRQRPRRFARNATHLAGLLATSPYPAA